MKIQTIIHNLEALAEEIDMEDNRRHAADIRRAAADLREYLYDINTLAKAIRESAEWLT